MGIEHIKRETPIEPKVDKLKAAWRPSFFESMLRKLVPRVGLLTTAILPSIVIAIVAAVVVGISEYSHESLDQMLITSLVVGVVVFMVSTALIYPAARTISELLHKEGELDLARSRLKSSEQRFRNIAEAASDWFWEMGPDLRFTFFSERVGDIVGVPADFHIGKTRAELAGEDIKTGKWQDHIQDLKEHKPFKDFRYVRKGHDGRLQTLSTSGKPLFDDAGTFIGYIGVGSDLTTDIEAADLARLANERLAAAVEAMSELFVLWDAEDRLVICNEQFRRINAQVIETTKPGTLFADHIHAALSKGLFAEAKGREDEWLAERLQRHAAPGKPFEQERLNNQWLYIHEQKFSDGSTVTISSDVTHIKRKEAELAKSQQRLTDFANTAADWFWEQDENFRFTYVSQSNSSISGMPAEAHYGLTRRETNPLGVSNAMMLDHEMQLKAHRTFEDFRFFRITRNGARVYLSTSGKPIFDDDGAFQGYRGVGRNITDLVEAEQQVREERDRAEDANRAKSEFLARMSHELRTPMNAILGFSQMISDEIFGPVGTEHYRDYATDIHRSGEHLLSLINDLLDLSRIEAGKLELEDRQLDIGQVIDDVQRLFVGAAETADVQVEIRVAPELPVLMADQRAVRQMITNLLSNAIKFTDTGGRVIISALRNEDGLIVAITDTGAGFDQSDLDLVLAPFGRVDKPMVRTVDGTGLGLPIVKNLIELHGGTFTLQSVPGEGTTATLCFPPERLSDVDQYQTPDKA
jgi:PAS domain S-box-containing protein